MARRIDETRLAFCALALAAGAALTGCERASDAQEPQSFAGGPGLSTLAPIMGDSDAGGRRPAPAPRVDLPRAMPLPVGIALNRPRLARPAI